MTPSQSRVEHAATQLEAIYEEPFGGKARGRFRIRRGDVRALLGLKRLDDHVLGQLTDECFERGYALINRDAEFAMLSLALMDNYRLAPKQLAAGRGFDGEREDADVPTLVEDEPAEERSTGRKKPTSPENVQVLTPVEDEPAEERSTGRRKPTKPAGQRPSAPADIRLAIKPKPREWEVFDLAYKNGSIKGLRRIVVAHLPGQTEELEERIQPIVWVEGLFEDGPWHRLDADYVGAELGFEFDIHTQRMLLEKVRETDRWFITLSPTAPGQSVGSVEPRGPTRRMRLNTLQRDADAPPLDG